MNLQVLNAIKAQISAIDASSAELRLLQSQKTVSLSAINQVETDLQQAKEAVSAAVAKTSTQVLDPISDALRKQLTTIADNPSLYTPAAPMTAYNYVNTAVTGNLNSQLKLADDISSMPTKLAGVTSAVSSKTAALDRIAAIVAQKKASLSAADLAKLNAMPKPSLADLTRQVSAQRAQLDTEFAK